MSGVGIVLISHSEKIVQGLKEIIRQVITEVPVEVAGGTEDGDIGTNIDKIMVALRKANHGEGVLVFYDLGSAKMNAEMALEMMEEENIVISEAPLVEGSYVAAVEASTGKKLADIVESLRLGFDGKQ